MQGGLSMREMFVCPSVCQTRELRQNERNLYSHFYTIRFAGHIHMYFAIMSAEYRLPLLKKADPPCNAVSLQ